MHVFTNRVDKNFNGVKDPGDIEAQWTIIDRGSHAVENELIFPWADVKASRPALDRARGLMYVGIGDSVWAYTSVTMVRGSDPIYQGANTALSVDGTGTYLYISRRPSFTDPGVIHRIDLNDLSTASFPTGVNPQQSVALRLNSDNEFVAVVHEGTFGNPDGGLTLIKNGVASTIELGDTPNYVAGIAKKGIAYVAMNGGHEVAVVDLVNEEVMDRWPTNTEGFDGPREIALAESYAFVTSYASKVHVFNLQTGEMIGEVEMEGKMDPINLIGSTLWIGRAFESDSYDAIGNIYIYPLNVVTVAEVMERHKAPKAILASGSTVRIPSLDATAGGIEIHDLQGATRSANVIDAETSTIGLDGLPSGTYVVSDQTTSIVMTVLR